ncbi:hypothetical protein K435DRAFT_669064, partial [Dendrothele bispora CBS 962.96]
IVFKWIFIPWLQLEIDAHVDRVNSTKKRAQRHKILPHGPADDIDEHPFTTKWALGSHRP